MGEENSLKKFQKEGIYTEVFEKYVTLKIEVQW